MPISSNGEHSFQIEISGAIAATIRQLQRQASREGRGLEFLRALRRVAHRLHRDPNRFGEPLYRLPGMHMQVRCAAIIPLSVNFAVYEDRPLVYIQVVKLLSAGES